MASPVYYIEPRDGGRWAVIKQGASRAASTHENKSAAKKNARNLGRRHGGSVRVKDRRGRIISEWTYGDDQYPPRG